MTTQTASPSDARRDAVASWPSTSLAVGAPSRHSSRGSPTAGSTAQPAGSPSRSRSARWSRPDRVAWIGYAVPVVDGERIMCCFGGDTTWIYGNVVTSTARRAAAPAGSSRRPTARRWRRARRAGQPAAERGAARRLRADGRALPRRRAGGRSRPGLLRGLRARRRRTQVMWLEGVRPADSIALLESFVAPADGRRDRVSRRRDHRRSRCTAIRRPTRRSSGWSRRRSRRASARR